MFEKFIEKWTEMESTAQPTAVEGFLKMFNAGYQGNVPEIASEVEDLCLDLFIDDDGSPNYGNIREIRNHGFKVYPTETDSFGWLMAACEKLDTHSIIYFG